jgi:hypothetical protein
MASTALPFVVGNANPADRLLEMLESVDTKRNWMVWCRDFLDFQHMLSTRDQRSLVSLATARRSELCREAA